MNKDLKELALRTTIPLFGFKEFNDSDKPDTFGCGFAFEILKGSYLITTAHLIYEDMNNETLESILTDQRKDYIIKVDTKIIDNDKVLPMILSNFNSILEFTQMDHHETSLLYSRSDFIFTLLPDSNIAFEEVESKNFSNSLHGIFKFKESMINYFDITESYYVLGYLNNRYNNRDQLERDEVFFLNLHIDTIFENGEALLYLKISDLLPKLDGISGAPIINSKCELCGMITNANRLEKTFTAYPIHKIISTIKKYELLDNV